MRMGTRSGWSLGGGSARHVGSRSWTRTGAPINVPGSSKLMTCDGKFAREIPELDRKECGLDRSQHRKQLAEIPAGRIIETHGKRWRVCDVQGAALAVHRQAEALAAGGVHREEDAQGVHVSRSSTSCTSRRATRPGRRRRAASSSRPLDTAWG